MIYHSDLTFPCPLFKDQSISYKFPKVRHTRLDIETLNPQIFNIFSELNLSICLVEVFYSKPFYFSQIHCDQKGGDINKINWVFGDTNCKMNWYSIKNYKKNKLSENTTIGTSYQSFSISEVKLEYSKILKNCALVNVGVPHNVHNSLGDRWCVSVVYRFKNSNIRPTMAKSLELFKSYLSLE